MVARFARLTGPWIGLLFLLPSHFGQLPVEAALLAALVPGAARIQTRINPGPTG